MKCPYCGHSESKVVDSRPAEEGSSIRRRRECLGCAKRFTTYETVESLPMIVVKKDGSRQIEAMSEEIEQTLQNSLEREISSDYVGELVMAKLRPVDEVAYIRFASVHRHFKNIDDFMHELNKLIDEK